MTEQSSAALTRFGILHRPTNNFLGEFPTREEAEACIADFSDADKFEIVDFEEIETTSATLRERFEASHEPQDFLRWLNAYTNQGRGDDELHALCSWAHSVIAELQNETQRLRKLIATAVSGIRFDA